MTHVVSKDAGVRSNIVIENSETHRTCSLGPLTMEIKSVLMEAGCVFEHDKEGYLNISDPWCIPITVETATKLQGLAFKMKRPIRARTEKKPSQKPQAEKTDWLDLICGI